MNFGVVALLKQMETLEKITSITQRGKELRAFALPTRAVILDVLDVLTQADIDNIGRRNVPNQERLAEISRILGYQERIVSVALGKLIRLDLVDYSNSYSWHTEYYRSSNRSDKELLSVLRGDSRDEAIFCVLHDIIYCWSHLIPSWFDIIIEDNDRYHLCKGYLIDSGKGYQTSIDLLSDSYFTRWPNWEALWRYF